MTVYPETARSLCARFDSSPCVDRGQEIVVIGCDLYNGIVTGGVACNMNVNSNASANHAGPSVLISKASDNMVILCDQGGTDGHQ